MTIWPLDLKFPQKRSRQMTETPGLRVFDFINIDRCRRSGVF